MADAQVSVIVPTRNRARYLRRALDSICAQRLPAKEIIVVDDASSDNTEATVANYNSSRIRYLRCPKQRGAGHARNMGIDVAKGRYLAFLDDDDLWMPDKLALQVEHLQRCKEQVGMVCCAYRIISEISGTKVKTWVPPKTPMDAVYFLRTTGFMTTIPLIRSHCFAITGGFDEQLTGSQDRDMWVRIADAFGVAAIPQILAEHRIHGSQITTNLPAKAAASALMLIKYYKRLSQHGTLLPRHLKRTALLHCAAGLTEAGRTYLREAISLTPNDPKLHEHLSHSQQDPTAHAAALIEQEFHSVDGVRLFY